MQSISVDTLTCNLFRLLCKSWLIYTQDCILQVDYHRLWIIRDRIMPLLEIYCTFSIEIGSFSTCISTFKKRRFEFFDMRILPILLLKSLFFLMVNTVKRSSSWQKRLNRYHTFEILLICVVNLNTIIDISVTLLFTLFGCLKWLNEVYIHCFIVIQVIDDRIYFDLPSVQNVNSNNYFRCLWMSGFISLNTIHKSSSTYRLSPAFVQWVALCMSLLVEHLSTVLYSPYIVTQTTTCMEERAVYHFGK